MTQDEAVEKVSRVLAKVIEEKGEGPVEIGANAVVLGGDLPIDSLDLATVVIELEEAIGIDPFKGGFVEFRTVAELARLYVE